MTGAWQTALDRLDSALDRQLGEAVSIVPMRLTDFGKNPDPERPAFDVTALVDWLDPASAQIPHTETRVVHEEVHVEVRRIELAGRRVAKNDEILLLDRPGSPRVAVNFVQTLDPGRVVFVCGPARD